VRSIKPEILLLSVSAPTWVARRPSVRKSRPRILGKDWVGGYFCPCHGSHYDLAGRVYKSQPAPLNLPVPPHSYETDDIIVIGVDTEKA
jgi:ubiquinol-cytochrome c reductase iron-sulfur subunit